LICAFFAARLFSRKTKRKSNIQKKNDFHNQNYMALCRFLHWKFTPDGSELLEKFRFFC